MVNKELLRKSCTCSDGNSYYASIFRRRRETIDGRQYYARFFMADADNLTKEIGSMRSIKSLLRYPFLMWPPETISTVRCVENGFCIEFEDPDCPWEAPILPFNIDKPSRWIAIFDKTTKRWSIQWVNYLFPEDDS